MELLSSSLPVLDDIGGQKGGPRHFREHRCRLIADRVCDAILASRNSVCSFKAKGQLRLMFRSGASCEPIN